MNITRGFFILIGLIVAGGGIGVLISSCGSMRLNRPKSILGIVVAAGLFYLAWILIMNPGRILGLFHR
jgi:hypothetical protein